MTSKVVSTFLEGFHNRCRAGIEWQRKAEGVDSGQVLVRADLGPAMRQRKPMGFLKLF
jgi:hypothetical protein